MLDQTRMSQRTMMSLRTMMYSTLRTPKVKIAI